MQGSEINAFLLFTQKLAPKSGRKTILGENRLPDHSADTLRVKNIAKIALSHTISEKFKQKFKIAAKNGEEMIFGKSGQFTVQIP